MVRSLRKWDDKIDGHHEYRCFILKGMCEVIARKSDFCNPDESIQGIINQTLTLDINIVDAHITVIEFNPVDTYDISITRD